MIISRAASKHRLAQSRDTRRRWAVHIAAIAALILTVCIAQHSTAQVTIHVNTTQQGVTNVRLCSLQEAIYSSEFKASIAVGSTNPDTFYTTGCVAGTGKGDTIVLPPGAVFTFDHFWDGDSHNIYGPTATPVIFVPMTIEGNGATLRWVDVGFSPRYSRLFAVGTVNDPGFASGTGDLALRNVYVKGFHIKGGNGSDGGGGGGLGAGGAIFVDGFLTVENSTFERNGAVGGNGSGGGSLSGGGGGGLSGNGGAICNAGGGGGGARGNGGRGACVLGTHSHFGGGGGGGTVFSGGDGGFGPGGSGGFRCGGNGGDYGDDGHEPACPGAGGGGGGFDSGIFGYHGDGAAGGTGGGGGGGAGDGGNGGFGGGGAAGSFAVFSLHGGNGGFGGGGGAAGPGCGSLCSAHPGTGGSFGGRADGSNGGGGGALGGAIFSTTGRTQVRNSTFYNNYVTRGVAGGGSADNGADAGGAIFSAENLLEVTDSTFSENQSTGSGGAIVVYSNFGETGFTGTTLILNNTIIAHNGANECFFTGSFITIHGAGNLIMNNGSGTGPFSPCPGVVSTSDPLLQPLQLNGPGKTPTMAISPSSPAFNSADPGTSLSTDQRGVARPQLGGFDIGAFEFSRLKHPPLPR